MTDQSGEPAPRGPAPNQPPAAAPVPELESASRVTMVTEPPPSAEPFEPERRVRSPSRLLYRGAMFQLGVFVVRFRTAVVLVWMVLLLLGSLGAWNVHKVLQAEQGSVPDSQSSEVNRLLSSAFAENLFAEAVVVAFDSSGPPISDASYRQLLQRIRDLLAKRQDVARVLGWTPQDVDPQFVSQDGRRTFLAAVLTHNDVERAKELVRALRQALAERPPSIQTYVTGNPAIAMDALQTSLEQGSRAEQRAIPIALLILLLAFGAPVAAALPLAVGVVSFIISLAVLYVLGQYITILVYAQNLITMLGLGIGIDYSLLLVTRFREELRAGHAPDAAVVKAVATAGRSIVYSGLPVAIGLSTLLIPNLPTMRSIGMGSVTVVLVTVLAAITLLPAVLALIGRGIDAPRRITNLVNWMKAETFWYRWAQAIMDRPRTFLGAALVLLIMLTIPLAAIRLQSPNIEMMPDSMESKKGAKVLQSLSAEGYYAPTEIIVRTTDGSSIWASDKLAGIYKLSQHLRQDGRISQVISLMDLRSDFTRDDYMGMYANPLVQSRLVAPEVGNNFVTTDDSATVLHAFQSKANNYATLNALVHELRELRLPELAGTEILVGGIAANNADFDERLFGKFPLIVGLVLLLTYVTLLFFFRSVLLPLSAIFMNLVSVGASYGLLVLVFQFGFGSWLVGLETAPGAIMNTTPVLLFCLIFGLSMDYEVFLMSRIREEYERTGRNREATARGLEKTAGIITSAALIMIAVFLAFTFAEILMVKEIGFALATAIIIDATIVRIVLAPALMRLLGRWNWWMPRWMEGLLPNLSH